MDTNYMPCGKNDFATCHVLRPYKMDDVKIFQIK